MAEESSTQSSQSQSSSHKSSEDAPKNLQGPGFCGNGASSNGAVPTFPIMYPALVPWLFILQNQEKMNHVAGIYAIHVPPFMSHVTGFPPNTLIPLTYSIPSGISSFSEAETTGEQGHVQPAATPSISKTSRSEEISNCYSS